MNYGVAIFFTDYSIGPGATRLFRRMEKLY